MHTHTHIHMNAVITMKSKLHIPEIGDEPGFYLKSLPSTLIDKVFSFPQLLPPCVALKELQLDPCQWNSFRFVFLNISLSISFWPSTCKPFDQTVCTAQPEGGGSGMLRSFKFYSWSPYADTKPFLCEAASLTVTVTGMSIATSSYFHFRDKHPKLSSSGLFFNVTSTTRSLRTTSFIREGSWRP